MEEYTSYRFGAGRYLQEQNILDYCADEIKRYGKQPYIIGGPNALNAAWERMQRSLQESDLSWQLEKYEGLPSYEKLELLKEAIKSFKADVLVGVGGGRIMDLAKAAAAQMKIPVLLVPTSCATCASFSPLSVMYTEEGQCVGYLHFDYEVNAVLVDEQVMAVQPPRLLAAGIMDSMAKYIEISNGRPTITLQTDSIEKFSAYTMAENIYHILEQHGKEAYRDVSRRALTKTVHNVVFCTIALTGLVSALMRAKKQTAIAHKFYEIVRTHYFKESIQYLHGEIVATGLIAQLKFNQNTSAIEGLKKYMSEFKMPMTLQDLGLNTSEEVLQTIFNRLAATEFVENSKEDRRRLEDALKEIY